MSLLNLVAKLILDTSEYEHSIGEAEKSAGGFGNAFKKVADLGVKAFTAAEAAVSAFTVKSIKTGADFDKSMSQVYATMGDKANEMVEYNGKTVSSMEALRDFAQEMGATTQYSAKQSADALNYMALAGYNATTSMQMLPNVMNLAAAGGFDLAKASDMVTDTQTAFGISIDRTTQMVDEMAKAASTGNTSVEQLGDAFLVVGGLAKELNGGFVTLADGTQKPVDGIQEMEIALTAMANAGVKGSEAGTHMRNMIMKLSSPTKEGVEQMQALGVSVFDNAGRMRSLQDIMGDLNGALGNLTQEEKIKAIADLFNARDLASAQALLGAVEQDWNAIGESIINADGAAEEMKNTQLDNLAGDLTIFKSAVEGAQIAISDKLSPSLRDFVQIGTKGISEFTEKMRNGDVENAIKSVGNSLGQLAYEALSKVPDLVKAGAVLLQGLGEGMVSAASSAFGDVDLSGVIQTIVMPMLVGISGYIRESSGEFVDAALSIIDGIGIGMVENSGALLTPMLTVLTNVIGAITDNAQMLFDAGLALLTKVGEGLVTAIPSFLAYVLPIITQFTASLRENAGKLVDVGLDFILNLAQGIMNSLPTLIEQIPQIVINIAGVINDNAPKVLLAGFQLLVTLGKGIIEAIPNLIENIPLIYEAIVAVWSAINWMSLGRNVITWIKNGFNALRNNLPNTLKSIGQSAVDFFKGIDWANLGSTAIDLIAGALNAAFTTIPGVLLDIANDAWNAFVNVDWSDVGSKAIEGIVNGLKAGVGWIKEAAADAASEALRKAKDILGIKSPSRVFRDEVGLMIGRGMALGIDDSESYVDKAISALNTELNDGIGAIDMPAIEMAPTAYIKGKNAMSDGKVVYITNNIQVDGAESPESYAHRLVQELELEMRTA